MKYEGFYISVTPDTESNEGGFYCQVYTDEMFTHEVHDFCMPNLPDWESRDQYIEEEMDSVVDELIQKLEEEDKKDKSLYVIDPNNYQGFHITSMKDGVHNDYEEGETLEDMRKKYNNPNLIAVSWDEVLVRMKEYHMNLQGAFEEITEERYDSLFNCLPPVRWKGGRFFLGEAYSGSIHSMCFALDGKFYEGKRSITLSDSDIAKQISEFAESLKNKIEE